MSEKKRPSKRWRGKGVGPWTLQWDSRTEARIYYTGDLEPILVAVDCLDDSDSGGLFEQKPPEDWAMTGPGPFVPTLRVDGREVWSGAQHSDLERAQLAAEGQIKAAMLKELEGCP